MAPKLYYTAQCRICNPHPYADPLVFDDLDRRNAICIEHANKYGHPIDVGFTFL